MKPRTLVKYMVTNSHWICLTQPSSINDKVHVQTDDREIRSDVDDDTDMVVVTDTIKKPVGSAVMNRRSPHPFRYEPAPHRTSTTTIAEHMFQGLPDG